MVRFIRVGFVAALIIAFVPLESLAQQKKQSIHDLSSFVQITRKYFCRVEEGKPNTLGLIKTKKQKPPRFVPVAKGLLRGTLRAVKNGKELKLRGVKAIYAKCLKETPKDMNNPPPSGNPPDAKPPAPPPPKPTAAPDPTGVPTEGFPERLLLIEVSNESGSSELEIPFDEGQWAQEGVKRTWQLAAPLQIKDPATQETIATLLNASISLERGSLFRQDISYQLLAGSSATVFKLTGGEISFPEIPASQAEARASASLSVLEMGGDGAALRDLDPPGSGIGASRYNQPAPAGEVFANLVSLVSCAPGPGCQGTGSGYVNWTSLPLAASSMSKQIRAVITAGDKTSGATSFSVRRKE